MLPSLRPAALAFATCFALGAAGGAQAQTGPDAGQSGKGLGGDATSPNGVSGSERFVPGGQGLGSILFENSNPDACDFTDRADFTVSVAAYVTRIAVWYRWTPGQTRVRYSLSRNGQVIRSGVLRRGDCDPYQTDWCNAEVEPGEVLPVGDYVVQTAQHLICQNERSDGQGVIRVYGWLRRY